jgi:hypothetical protein
MYKRTRTYNNCNLRKAEQNLGLEVKKERESLEKSKKEGAKRKVIKKKKIK